MMDFSLKPIFLAPMAGITDSPFRQICKMFHADILESEMISSKGLYYNDKKTESLLLFEDSERPFGIQIFGSEPDIMAYAAKHIYEKYSPDYIDINMGCPMPKIFKNGDGSALMKNPKLACEIVRAVSMAVEIPVGVKIRKGLKNGDESAPEFAKYLEDGGASFITVHGRTVEQLYSGKADYSSIAKVKSAISIPVIGNGDIFSAADAKRMFEVTGCDGIMVGRGSLGNPFIFSQIKKGSDKPVPMEEKINTASIHLRMLIETKGEKQACLEMRKHFAWYIKGISNAARYKEKIFNASSLEDYQKITDQILNK